MIKDSKLTCMSQRKSIKVSRYIKMSKINLANFFLSPSLIWDSTVVWGDMNHDLPLLTPLVSLKTVHSSMVPKELNIALTSFSLYFLDTMPTKSFLSFLFSVSAGFICMGWCIWKVAGRDSCSGVVLRWPMITLCYGTLVVINEQRITFHGPVPGSYFSCPPPLLSCYGAAPN